MFKIKKRILKEANYIIKNNTTLRKTANHFNLSKSTIHKDMSERLIKIDKNVYFKVKKIMKNNLKYRHIKGGEVTKLKYKSLRK